jgi:1,4-dihydroxy-2-naphthoate octaprenyltransferase
MGLIGLGAVFQLNEQQRLVLINIVGLAALATFTGLVYERTQEPLILIVGGLISVVGVLGMMTSKA